MNKLNRTVLAACLAFALSSASAQVTKDEHASHHPDDKPATASGAPAPAGDAQDAATMQKMQANMKTMRELMTKIQTTTDPAARRSLMQQHLQLMHTQMQLMHGMGPMSGQCGAMMGGETTTPHPMMQDRMNMMQMMMDQMMQREDVSESKSEKPAQ